MATFGASAQETRKIIDEKGLAVVFDERSPKLVGLENITHGSEGDRSRNQPDKKNTVESGIFRISSGKKTLNDQLARLTVRVTTRNPNIQYYPQIKELFQAESSSAKARRSKIFEKALDEFEEKHTASSHKGKIRAEGAPVFDYNEVISSVQKAPALAAHAPAEDNLSEDELAGPSTKAKGKQPVRRQTQPKSKKMSFEGIDLTAEAGQINSISWQEPHPVFVIALVGPDETPFGIQKDLLCAKSPYYREEFAQHDQNKIEYIIHLPDTSCATFGCFQSFVYTGKLYDKELGQEIPDYPLLMGVWKLATQLKMPPLRVAVLNVMAERRQATGFIPGTPLLIQAWKETEEGSGLRTMLITWAAEHMRTTPEIRNDFARSLPQEILSELVIVMADLPAAPTPLSRPAKHPLPAALINTNADLIPIDAPRPLKRARKSAPGVGSGDPLDEDFDIKPITKKPARKSEPAARRPNRRVSTFIPTAENDTSWTPEKEMEFCRGLIERMTQGPGYWTRLVGPFRNPVDPIADQVPNYFTVVKQPMDLSTIKSKIDAGSYRNGKEFENDVRLIFQNCYEYWTQEDGIWRTCMEFEKYFDEQWASRHRWSEKGKSRIKAEVLD